MNFLKSYKNLTLIVFCLFFIKTIECEINSIYLGKNLTELAKVDQKLNIALNQTYWDIICFNTGYFYFKNPSNNHIKMIKNNINLFDKTIQEINDCIIKTEEEVSIIKNRISAIEKINNNSITTLVVLALLPIYIGLRISDENTINKKQNQINIMINSERELKTKSKTLNKILLKYQ